METYQELVASGIKAAQSQWTLGDLAAQVETHYAEHSLEDYADDIGVDYTTLRIYRYVVSRYPQNVLRGTFSIAKELAAQDDRAELIKTVKTVREARAIVSARNNPVTTVAIPVPVEDPDSIIIDAVIVEDDTPDDDYPTDRPRPTRTPTPTRNTPPPKPPAIALFGAFVDATDRLVTVREWIREDRTSISGDTIRQFQRVQQLVAEIGESLRK